MTCSICNDRLHVKTSNGWRRCVCAQKVVSDLYIKKNIKSGYESYDPKYDKEPPYPLLDCCFQTKDYTRFRNVVWRSLHVYEASDLRYDYLDAYRLVEIFLGQDSEYSRIRDLDNLGLVILVLGVADAPNRMLPSLVCQLITQRKMNGLPTWIYIPLQGSQARAVYGNEMCDLLNTLLAVKFERKAEAANYVD